MNRARLPIAVLASLLLHLAIGSGLLLTAFHSFSQPVPVPAVPNANANAAVPTHQRISVTLWNTPSVSSKTVTAPVAAKPSRAKRAAVVAHATQPAEDGIAVATGGNESAEVFDSSPMLVAGTVPAQEGQGLDLFPLNQKLRSAARSCYPPVAARFRLQGTAKVAFCVGNHGEVSQVRLVQSTGSGMLDAAAGGCVLERARPLPIETSGRCFELPVQFEVGT